MRSTSTQIEPADTMYVQGEPPGLTAAKGELRFALDATENNLRHPVVVKALTAVRRLRKVTGH